MKKILLTLALICQVAHGKYTKENVKKDVDTLFSLVSDTHEIRFNNHIVNIDMRKLMEMTAYIESNMAEDKYSGRIAKTYMQIEPKSAYYYMGVEKELVRYFEEKLGRKIYPYKDQDAMYVAYIIYMAKLHLHTDWIDKFRNKGIFYGDFEWYIYKIYYNSIKGATTYKKWNKIQINKYYS